MSIDSPNRSKHSSEEGAGDLAYFLGQQLISAPDVDAGLEAAARTLVEAFDADRSVITTYLSDTESALQGTGFDRETNEFDHTVSTWHVPDEILELFQSQTSVNFSKKRLEAFSQQYRPFELRLEQGFDSMVIVGIHWQDKPVGWIALWSKSGGFISPEDLDLLTQISLQLSPFVGYLQIRGSLNLEVHNQTQISEMVTALSASESVEEGFESFTKLAYEFLGGTRVSAAVYEPGSKVLTDRFGYSAAGGFYHQAELQDAVFPEIVGTSEDNPVMNLDRVQLEYFATQIRSVSDELADNDHSAIATRFWWQNRPIGSIVFYSDAAHTHGKRESDLLQMIAEAAAGPIGYLLTNRGLEIRHANESALARIGEIIGSDIELEAVFDRVSEVLAEIIDFDVIMVTVPNGENTMMRNMPVAGPLSENFKASQWYKSEATIAKRTIDSRQPLRESLDATGENDRSKPQYELGLSRSLGITSAMAIPLISKGEPFAALQFRSRIEGAFDELSDDFLTRIAEQVAGAVALDQVNERLESELAEQTALARIGQLISSSDDINTVFNSIGEVLRSIVEFDSMLVNIIEKDSKTRRIIHHYGVTTPLTKPGIRQPLNGSMTELVMRTGKLLRSVDEFEFLDEYSHHLPNMKEDFKSQITIPLLAQNDVIGTLQFRSFDSSLYPHSQFRFLTLIAEQISGGIAREALNESQNVLAIEREKAQVLESQNQDLVQNRRVRERFLGMVTHELRTPLTSISAFTDILGHNKEANLTERQLHQLRVVSRNSTQLSELIDDLIHMSRMERGEFELTFDQSDISELVRQACESMAPMLAHRNQSLVTDIEPRRLRLSIDHSRITQVINNLISNASKFSPTDSTVRINMTTSNNHVEIEVNDEGPGIDTTEAESIFDPFYRVDSDSVKVVPGTGLGLYVARTIIRQHGGDITVQPSEVGAALLIRIPIERPDLAVSSPS